jgi:hypothetical protein
MEAAFRFAWQQLEGVRAGPPMLQLQARLMVERAERLDRYPRDAQLRRRLRERGQRRHVAALQPCHLRWLGGHRQLTSRKNVAIAPFASDACEIGPICPKPSNTPRGAGQRGASSEPALWGQVYSFQTSDVWRKTGQVPRLKTVNQTPTFRACWKSAGGGWAYSPPFPVVGWASSAHVAQERRKRTIHERRVRNRAHLAHRDRPHQLRPRQRELQYSYSGRGSVAADRAALVSGIAAEAAFPPTTSEGDA